MANAAQTTKNKGGIRIAFQTTDGKDYEMNCGNYTFERVGAHDGGPIILTLLRDKDRKSETNEPILVMSGVRSYWLVNDVPELNKDDSAEA